MNGPLAEALKEHRSLIARLADQAAEVTALGATLVDALERGGTVFWLGNGGSAADSQHLAADLVGRFEGRDRPGLRSVALTTDTSVLTSVGNDFGFERVFARQIEALCTPRDVVVALSTSGRSPNVLEAVRTARRIGAATLALCGGDGGDLAALADHALVIDSASPARVQEVHITIGHIWCAMVDARYSGQPEAEGTS